MDDNPNILPSGISLIVDNLLKDCYQTPKKFIINLNDSSASSDEDDEEEDGSKETIDFKPIPQELEQNQINSEMIKSIKNTGGDRPEFDNRHLVTNEVEKMRELEDAKLKEQQIELMNQLKDRCSKQEKSNQLRLNLVNKEVQYKQLRLRVLKKRAKMSDLTGNVSLFKVDLARKQTKAKKFYKSYTKATEEANQLCVKINDCIKALRCLEKEVNTEQQEINTLEEECRKTRAKLDENELRSLSQSNDSDGGTSCLENIKEQLEFLNNLIITRQRVKNHVDTDDHAASSPFSDTQVRPMSVCSMENYATSPIECFNDSNNESPIPSNSNEYMDSNRVITPESSVEFELNTSEENSNPSSSTNNKPVLTKAKKDTLLRKILLVESKNEICEIAKNKKDQLLKKQIEDQRKEHEINVMKRSLRSKQLLNKLAISFKEVLMQSQSVWDTIDDQDFYLTCLNYFTDNVQYPQMDHLQLEQDRNESNFAPKAKRIRFSCPDVKSNARESVLEHLDSFRLSLAKEQMLPADDPESLRQLIHSSRGNCLDPDIPLCLYDLHGTCNDEECQMQHRSDYTLTDKQKIIDLLLYKPSITRFPEVNITRQNMKALREHLEAFVDNLLEKYSVCQAVRYVITLIRSSCDDSVLDLTRCISKQQAFECNRLLSNQNTFADYRLNFKLQDRDNVLTFKKIKNPTIFHSESLEMYRNRYFEPEPVSLIDKFENDLKINKNNIEDWIRLAYLHLNSADLSMESHREKLDLAIKVICEALEHNRENAALWCTYLFFLSNRLNAKSKNAEHFDKTLHTIVRRVLVICPNYQIWKVYLSLCVNYLDKELLSSELLEEIQTGRLLYFDKHNSRDFRLASACYLEVVFYKVALHLELGQTNRAITFLSDLLCADLEDLLEDAESNELSAAEIVRQLFNRRNQDGSFTCFTETNVLVRQDKLFAWLCLLHLHFFGCLPKRSFTSVSRSFGPNKSFITTKQPFLIKFTSLDVTKVNQLLVIFHQALIDCFLNVESNPDEYVYSKDELICLCLPLFQNLIRLCQQSNDVNGAIEIYDLLRLQSPSLITLTVCKALFEASLNLVDKSLYSLCSNNRYKERNIGILFPICLLHYKQGNVILLNRELAQIIHLFTTEDDHIPINQAFHKLMVGKNGRFGQQMEFFQTINARLWILYLVCELANGSNERIDSVYQNLIALSQANKEVDEYSLFLINLLYLDFSVTKVHTDADLSLFIDKLKFACAQLHSSLLQYRLITLFATQLFKQPLNRFLFVQHLFTFFFDNVYLLKELAALCAGQRELRSRLYSTLKVLIDRCDNQQTVPLLYWNLLLYSAISAKQHLEVHQYFQRAISNHPYNKMLWKHFIDYEQSLEHTHHIELIQRTLKRLKLPQFC